MPVAHSESKTQEIPPGESTRGVIAIRQSGEPPVVLQLVLGGIVNFAESIDTVAVNIREIAPTFFLGVPRIWEKLQQNIMFRSEEPGNTWRWLLHRALRRGRVLADRRHTTP